MKICIGTIGQKGHGKTTLTTVIVSMLNMNNKNILTYHDIDTAKIENCRKVKIHVSYIEYETKNRQFIHQDCPEHMDYIKGTMSGDLCWDGAILVVSAIDDDLSETQMQLKLMKKNGLLKLIVFLNKIDLVENKAQLVKSKLNIIKILNKCGFDGENTPIVEGSALKALNDINGIWSESINKLIYYIDEYIPSRVNDIDKPFFMPIEEIFSDKKRGKTIVIGRIFSGIIHTDDMVEIVGFSVENKIVKCCGLEMFRRSFDEVSAGYSVAVLLDGITKEDIRKGQILAKPNTIKAYKKFECEIYTLDKDEKGLSKPLVEKYFYQFFFHTITHVGALKFIDNIDSCDLGHVAKALIELDLPIVLQIGDKFKVEESHIPIAIGYVTSLL